MRSETKTAKNAEAISGPQVGWRVDKSVHEDRTYQKAKSKFPEGCPNGSKSSKNRHPKNECNKTLKGTQMDPEVGDRNTKGCRWLPNKIQNVCQEAPRRMPK